MLSAYYQENMLEAGCDEAGRGCLAGPVCAAAVILPKDFYHPKLNDSKKLPEKVRNELRIIIENEAIAWAVAFVDHQEIDQINILNASILAMHRALDQLKQTPGFILVDGNRFKKYGTIPYQCMIKGDSRFASIAAASVLAKTYRDEFMLNLHQEFPQYLWNQNMGYPTANHRQAIRQYGITPYHRKSFRLLDGQLSFDF